MQGVLGVVIVDAKGIVQRSTCEVHDFQSPYFLFHKQGCTSAVQNSSRTSIFAGIAHRSVCKLILTGCQSCAQHGSGFGPHGGWSLATLCSTQTAPKCNLKHLKIGTLTGNMQNDLEFLRIRSKIHEFMIAPSTAWTHLSVKCCGFCCYLMSLAVFLLTGPCFATPDQGTVCRRVLCADRCSGPNCHYLTASTGEWDAKFAGDF